MLATLFCLPIFSFSFPVFFSFLDAVSGRAVVLHPAHEQQKEPREIFWFDGGAFARHSLIC